MGMMVARVVSSFQDRCVDGDIRHHALTDEDRAHEPQHQLLPFLRREFMRQGKIDFSRELGILSALRLFDGSPELLPVG